MDLQIDWDFDAVFHAILEEVCEEQGKTILRIEESAASFLEEVNWSHDFENLRRVLEEAVQSAEKGVIGMKDLPLSWVKFRRSTPSKIDSGWRLRVC